MRLTTVCLVAVGALAVALTTTAQDPNPSFQTRAYLRGNVSFERHPTLQANVPGGSAVEYCKSTVNSSGFEARTDLIGSLSMSQNDNWLLSTGCPPNTYGVFLMGATPGRLPFGDGFLCISPFESPIHRLGPPALTDILGGSERFLDFTNPEAPGCFVSGSTWYFQCYFRDLAAGRAGFNLASAVAVTFTD